MPKAAGDACAIKTSTVKTVTMTNNDKYQVNSAFLFY